MAQAAGAGGRYCSCRTLRWSPVDSLLSSQLPKVRVVKRGEMGAQLAAKLKGAELRGRPLAVPPIIACLGKRRPCALDRPFGSGPAAGGRFMLASARRAVAPFAHEVVEFGAILGHAQPLQEALEFLGFFFQPA